MKHRVGYNRLGRKASHRKAMLKNMATSLLRYERIRTTKAKAKEVRRLTERLITRGKTDSVHNRRTVTASIGDKAVVAKLFEEIGPRYVSRPGGYTRMLKLGQRQGDAAEMVVLELVEEDAGSNRDESAGRRRSGKKRSRASDQDTEQRPVSGTEAVGESAATTVAEDQKEEEVPDPAADTEEATPQKEA